MEEDIVVLLHGAPACGKSQLLNWRCRGAPKPSYNETIEDEFTLAERLCEQPVSVKFLDTGGHSEFAEMLPEWVSRCNAQMLVVNLEDPPSLDYVKKKSEILANAKLWGAVLVGNLPNGEGGRKVSTQQAVAFAASLQWAKFTYVETNTRTGNVELAFTTLMEDIGARLSPSGAERAERVAITGEVKKTAEFTKLTDPVSMIDESVASWAERLNLSKEATSVVAELTWEELDTVFVSDLPVVKQELMDYGLSKASERNKVIAGWMRRKALVKNMELGRVTVLEAKMAAQERKYLARIEALETQLAENNLIRRMQDLFPQLRENMACSKDSPPGPDASTPPLTSLDKRNQVRVRGGAGLFRSRSNSPVEME